VKSKSKINSNKKRRGFKVLSFLALSRIFQEMGKNAKNGVKNQILAKNERNSATTQHFNYMFTLQKSRYFSNILIINILLKIFIKDTCCCFLLPFVAFCCFSVQNVAF